ncbi:MAG: diphthine synthase [Candidatus Micrarchaeia archaeon]|jgi:diphthine synthase
MLFLVGLGLERGDISEKALEVIRRASRLMLDPYTNRIDNDYIEYLEAKTGKKLLRLSRSDLEENAYETIKNAKNEDIAILVPGDPLIATTHHTILDLAKKNGIEVKVFHAPSIFTAAIGESGLDIYRFGPTTTIPFWSKKYKPISFIDTIDKNLKNNEHTLVLLDYNYKEEKAMSLEEALALLEVAERERGVSLPQKIIVLADIGKASQDIAFGERAMLARMSKRFTGKIISLIIPSNPNFAEEEALSKYIISNI